jgi:hypothetical protein
MLLFCSVTSVVTLQIDQGPKNFQMIFTGMLFWPGDEVPDPRPMVPFASSLLRANFDLHVADVAAAATG